MTLSKVSCKYGAPMGRSSDALSDIVGKVHLRRVRLDVGGYDEGGAYWGTGEPLWHAYTEGTDMSEAFFRAPTRDAAKAKLPGRSFYR